MTAARRTRLLVAVTSGVLLASLVGVSPAQALPVFTRATLGAETGVSNESLADCSVIPTSSTLPAEVPVIENGAAASISASNTGRVVNDDDPGDVVEVATSITASARVTSQDGDPRTIDLSGSGQVTVSASRATSACLARAASFVDLSTAFTVVHPGFVTLSTRATPSALGTALIFGSDRSTVAAITGRGHAFDGTVTAFVAPGSYQAFLDVFAQVSSSVAVPTRSVQASVRIAFTLAGSLLTPVAGKGGRYVELPTTRTCATHTLVPSITGKRKRSQRIGQVRVFVNDVLVTKVKSPRRGVAVALPVADEQRAAVRAEVRLHAKGPARRGKVLETTATYEACS